MGNCDCTSRTGSRYRDRIHICKDCYGEVKEESKEGKGGKVNIRTREQLSVMIEQRFLEDVKSEKNQRRYDKNESQLIAPEILITD